MKRNFIVITTIFLLTTILFYFTIQSLDEEFDPPNNVLLDVGLSMGTALVFVGVSLILTFLTGLLFSKDPESKQRFYTKKFSWIFILYWSFIILVSIFGGVTL